MKTNAQLAKIIGISDELLRYYLTKKKDAPEPKVMRAKRKFARYYDEEEVLKFWDERVDGRIKAMRG